MAKAPGRRTTRRTQPEPETIETDFVGFEERPAEAAPPEPTTTSKPVATEEPPPVLLKGSREGTTSTIWIPISDTSRSSEVIAGRIWLNFST